jgi:hypothetical protein
MDDGHVMSAHTRQTHIAIAGACPCGVGYVPVPDSLDCGATLRCTEGHLIVFDVQSPEDRRTYLENVFRAGFAACSEGTTKYGEYIGLSIEEEFDDWIKNPST